MKGLLKLLSYAIVVIVIFGAAAFFLTKKQSHSASSQLEAGKKLLDAGSVTEAVDSMWALVRSHPKSKQAHEALLTLAHSNRFRFNDTEQAVRLYSRVLKEAPRSEEATKALIGLAEISDNVLNDFTRAASYYESAAARYDDVSEKAAELKIMAAKALMRAKEFEKAITLFQSSRDNLKEVHSKQSATLWMSQALIAVKKHEKAISLLEPMLKTNLSPGFEVPARLALSDAYESAKNLAKARDVLMEFEGDAKSDHALFKRLEQLKKKAAAPKAETEAVNKIKEP